MSTLKQSYYLFRVMLKDTFSKGVKDNSEKKNKKVAIMVAVSFGVLFMLIYICLYAYMVAYGAFRNGRGSDAIQFFIGISQMGVLLFGVFTTLSIFYYSKDNILLMSLPLNTKAVFTAKFGMSYITELVISLIISIPCLVVCGVVGISCGMEFGAEYFILLFIAAFLYPFIPLLVINLLSLPLMYVVSLVKKRALASTIVTVILIAGALSLYFYLIFGLSTMAETTFESDQVVLNPALSSMISIVCNITFFNLPIVNALTNVNAVANFFIYFAEIVGIAAITIILSSFFYPKGVSMVMEGSGSSSLHKKKKVENFVQTNLNKTLLLRELKTLFGTPVMLVSCLLQVFLCPALVYFISSGISAEDSGFGVSGGAMFIVGYATFMIIILSVSANQASMVGFSREGKNIYMLKSLPITAKKIVLSKLLLSMILSEVTILITTIVLGVILKNALAAITVFLVTSPTAFAGSCMSLYFDLKNPFLNWTNPSELNKNNKRAIKPMLVTLFVDLSFMVLAVVLGIINLPLTRSLFIFLAFGILLNVAFIMFTYKKLMDKTEQIYDEIE